MTQPDIDPKDGRIFVRLHDFRAYAEISFSEVQRIGKAYGMKLVSNEIVQDDGKVHWLAVECNEMLTDVIREDFYSRTV